MKIRQICNEYRIKPWKPAIHLVPHLTIEANMTCNFRCKVCYNLNTTHVKSMETICMEIDTGLKKRKVDTITIMGGEPTLHPNLFEIISYVKSKGVLCQLLTNGFLIYNDPDDQLLAALVSGGLNRIIFHIDKGQESYKNPFEVLHHLFSKTAKFKLLTSVSWTIYNDDQGYLPELVREFSKYKHFDGILALLEKPVDSSILPGFNRDDYPNLLEEHLSLKSNLKLQPSLYLPTSLDDQSVSWLIYLYFINTTNQQTFFVSPRLTRIFQKVYLGLFRREIFGNPPMRFAFGLSVVLTGLLEMGLNPARFGNYLRLIRKSSGFRNLRFHYIAIQDGPTYNKDLQNVSICFGCPDATIRNGKLTPVCLADRINPFPENSMKTAVSEELAELVFNHLNKP